MRRLKASSTVQHTLCAVAGFGPIEEPRDRRANDETASKQPILRALIAAEAKKTGLASLWGFFLREHIQHSAEYELVGAQASLELQGRDHTRLPHNDSTKWQHS